MSNEWNWDDESDAVAPVEHVDAIKGIIREWKAAHASMPVEFIKIKPEDVMNDDLLDAILRDIDPVSSYPQAAVRHVREDRILIADAVDRIVCETHNIDRMVTRLHALSARLRGEP
jgi:hypothetical protein